MPTKAIRERFETTNPDEFFDYRLCRELGWRSVAEMRRGMSMAEWQGWLVFFGIEHQRREMAIAQAGG